MHPDVIRGSTSCVLMRRITHLDTSLAHAHDDDDDGGGDVLGKIPREDCVSP